MIGLRQRALDAAGILDPALRRAYEQCRLVNADHGKTYYLSALMLPPDRRPHVYALYAFSRRADEFVDSLTAPDPAGLLAWGEAALADLERGESADPVIKAVGHTARTFGIDHQLFADFLAAMAMDIDITRYATYAEPRGYMWGSASVIGLLMLPLLETLTPGAHERAVALGEAFQMSNFIRDVGEDLRRGRVYLPQEDLARFAVTEADLGRGVVTPAIKDLLAFEIARTRALYDVAALGVTMVSPQSRACLQTAITLYREILAEVTIRRPVSQPLVSSWNPTMIAYDAQKALRSTNQVRSRPRSSSTLAGTATRHSWV